MGRSWAVLGRSSAALGRPGAALYRSVTEKDYFLDALDNSWTAPWALLRRSWGGSGRFGLGRYLNWRFIALRDDLVHSWVVLKMLLACSSTLLDSIRYTNYTLEIKRYKLKF